jgi:hypothetical protein
MPRDLFYLGSAVCTAWFRLHGVKSSLVACDGMLPALNVYGPVTIGKRLGVRGQIARCEIATKEGAQILIGDRHPRGRPPEPPPASGGNIRAWSEYVTSSCKRSWISDIKFYVHSPKRLRS